MLQEKEVKPSSPFLESSSFSGDAALRSSEWKAVPDIWRSSAEKYGDRVALVDPYHDPPLKLTYKQVVFLLRLLFINIVAKKNKQRPVLEFFTKTCSMI